MHQVGVEAFDTTLQKTHAWLREIREDLGWSSEHAAYLALRGVLHALRDRLPVDEAVQLGAQLPMLIRGLYYEGWQAAGKPERARKEEPFLLDVVKYFGGREQGELMSFQPGADAEAVVRAVFRVLSRHTTEAESIRHLLPAQLRALWPERELA
jgi:uncharacterized protein (DUF2267 family)